MGFWGGGERAVHTGNALSAFNSQASEMMRLSEPRGGTRARRAAAADDGSSSRANFEAAVPTPGGFASRILGAAPACMAAEAGGRRELEEEEGELMGPALEDDGAPAMASSRSRLPRIVMPPRPSCAHREFGSAEAFALRTFDSQRRYFEIRRSSIHPSS